MTRDQAIEFIKKTGIGYLATVDGNNSPCVRPMGIHTVYDDDIYFFTFKTTRKVAEMAGNPQVEVVWATPQNLSQVRVKGKVMFVDDEAVQERFKGDNPMVAKTLPAGAEHLFCLCKIIPEKVEAAEGLVPYSEVAW